MSTHRNRLVNLAALLGLSVFCVIAVVKTFGTTVSAKFESANTHVVSEVTFGGESDYVAAPPARAAGEVPAADTAWVEPRVRSGQLTASEWSDIDNWDLWTELMTGPDGQGLNQWALGLDHRFVVRATSQAGPARNVPVDLLNRDGDVLWSARTNGAGIAQLFAGTQASGPFRARVAGGEPRPLDAAEITVDVAAPTVAEAIDVMFVVDATGSMSDELDYVKAELVDVVNRVRAGTRNELSVRVGVSVYRDHQEEYLVRTSPMNANVTRAQRFLNEQSAGGGGDFPEAVNEALDEAISEQVWDTRARARILFLVLDAPPHQDAAGQDRLRAAVKRAAQLGIQVIPVVGSGIDKPTEFLMRALAISTNGTYVFLTDDSGIGGGHIKPTIGDHNVEPLNDLLVRLIVEAATRGASR